MLAVPARGCCGSNLAAGAFWPGRICKKAVLGLKIVPLERGDDGDSNGMLFMCWRCGFSCLQPFFVVL